MKYDIRLVTDDNQLAYGHMVMVGLKLVGLVRESSTQVRID